MVNDEFIFIAFESQEVSDRVTCPELEQVTRSLLHF